MTSLNMEDLVRARRDRLAMAQGKIEDRAQRLELNPPREPARIVRPQSEELALSAFPEIQPTVLPDEDSPPARKKLWGQSIADAIAGMADGTAAKKHGNPLLNIGTGVFKALEVSGNIATSIARPVIFGAQNYLLPGQQDLQRVTNQLRESGLSWGEALNRAYEETNLEGPTIPFFTTAFTPNGSITIDFEDVIEAGFDPIDLALTLATGGLGKAASVTAKQGVKAGLRTAAVESHGARLGRSAARTTSNLVQDPLSLVSPRLGVGLLNDVAPLRGKPVIAAVLNDVDTAIDVTFRKKTPARAIESLTKNVPLARRILGTRPAHWIAEKVDPSQTAGDSVPHRASVLLQQYGAHSANAVDAVLAYTVPDNLRKAFNPDPRTGRIGADNIQYTPAGAKRAAKGQLPKPEKDGLHVFPLLGDLMEGATFDASGRSGRNSLFTGLTASQRQSLNDYRAALEAVVQMAVDEGVLELRKGAVPGKLWKYAKEVETGASIKDVLNYVSRQVIDKDYIDKDGVAQKLMQNRVTPSPTGGGGKTAFDKSRIYEFMEEGAQQGIHYADPLESLEGLAAGVYRMVSEKRVKEYLTSQGQLVTELSVLKRLHPGLVGAVEQGKKFEKATRANVNRLKKKKIVRGAKRGPMTDALVQASDSVRRTVKEHQRLSEKFKELFIKQQDQKAKAKTAVNDGQRRHHLATAKRAEGAMQFLAQEVGRAHNDFRAAIEKTNVASRARTRLAKLEDDLMGVTDDLLTAEAELDLATRTSRRAEQAMNEKIAQIASQQTLDARVFGQTVETGREVPVGRFANPALQGSIAPRDTVDVLNKMFNDRGSNALRKVEAVTGTARTLSTGTLDIGWLAIQGSLLAFTHPQIYAKAAVQSLRAIFSPQLRELYLRKNMADLVDFIQSGGDIGSSEFFQMIDRGGMLSFVSKWALEKTSRGELLGEVVEKWGKHGRPIGRLGTGFNTFLDVGKLEMWKSMKNMPLNGHVAKRELATHINNMMGTMNTQLLGLSPSQRQLEGALLFFSPRYTRSAFALVGDLLQSPGKIGTMDGLAQRHAMQAIGGFLAGGTTTMWAIGQATGEDVELNPMKPGWLTTKVGGQQLGIGGSSRALLDLMVKAIMSVAGIDDRNPEDLVHLNPLDPDHRRSNPILQYWLNRTAPGVREVLTRETFDGEKLDSPGEFVLKGIAPKFLPFAIDSQLNPPQQVPRPSPFALVPEVLGLRARPLSAFERRNQKRDEVAKEIFSKDWEDLGMDEKAILRRDNEELNGLEELARNVEDPVFAPYFNRLNRDRQIKDRAIANAAAQFRMNPAGGRTFREQYDLAIAQERVLREAREDPNGEHASALKKLKESRDEKIDSQAVFDRQFDEYIADVRDNPEHRDRFGNVDFRAIDEAEQAFRKDVGDEAYARIRNHYRGFDNQGNQLRDTPVEVINLRRAREVLRENEYWKIPDRYIGDSDLLQEVWAEYQSLDSPAAREGLARRFPEIKRIATRVGRDRLRLRRRNADVDRALVVFYGLRAVNPEVARQERELIRFSRSQGRENTEGSFQIQ